MLSVTDGWDDTDDVYADDSDLISFAGGSDSTYYFQSTPVDVLCVAIDSGGFSRSQHYIINGHDTKNLVIWAYDGWTDLVTGEDVHLQVRGGDDDTCRFYFWHEKNDYCPDYWADSAADYSSSGCDVNVTGILDEGVTAHYVLNGDDYEITCAQATTETYLKCQADNAVDLHNCQIDSGFAGIDDMALNETCGNDDSSLVDTDSTCDIWDGLNELKLFYPAHLTGSETDMFTRGFHTSEFRVYAYTLCGTGIADRELIGSYNFTQLSSKQRICDSEDFYNYNLTGFIDAYTPWSSDDINSSLIYEANTCPLGTLCRSSIETYLDNADLSSGACSDDNRSCYDGATNRDEIEADYGGICGNCSSEGKKLDLLWEVARENHPKGFYDDVVFNASTQCAEADDSINVIIMFTIALWTIVIVLILLVLFLVFGLILGLVWPYFFRLATSAFKKKRNKGDKYKR